MTAAVLSFSLSLNAFPLTSSDGDINNKPTCRADLMRLYASVLMQRLSYPTETVYSNKITRNRIVLSFKVCPRKPLGRRPCGGVVGGNMDALQGRGTVRFRKEGRRISEFPPFKHCAPSLAPSLPTFCFPRPTNQPTASHSFIHARWSDRQRGRRTTVAVAAQKPRPQDSLTHSPKERVERERGRRTNEI